MKKSIILKAIVIIVPFLVAFYANHCEIKRQEKLNTYYESLNQKELISQYSGMYDKN